MTPKNDTHSAYLIDTGDEIEVLDADVVGISTTAASVPAAGTRAVLYLRVSSAGQVNTDYDPEGISIPAQRAAAIRKADQLGLTVIDEYVEPGRSGTEMSRRVAFQQMLARIRERKDVDCIIVHKLSRLARNRIDDAIVMADLRKRGVTLISATENIDESPVGQLMHGILAAFNEYRSREDGADIAYKMGEKAKKGGTIGRAPIGYLNTVDHLDGRQIRTVAIDPERGPFVTLAFELYATGNYTLADLTGELADRGLTTRPTARRPAKAISLNKLSQLLRDRYYLGYVTHQGEEYQGRHPALVDTALFDTVQQLMDTRGVAGERRRTHHHYLKGTLYCGHCRDQEDGPRRLILQRAIGRAGGEYFYFLCRGTQHPHHTCDAPYTPQPAAEDAVTAHYARIRFTPEFIQTVRAAMDDTLADTERAQRLRKSHLDAQLAKLDVQETNLINLAADGDLPQDKIRAKLREIKATREKIRAQLDSVTDDLAAGARLIDACLRLLENPAELYRQASDEHRRQLNQAIFERIYLYQDQIVDHDLHQPFAALHAQQGAAGTDGAPGRSQADTSPHSATRTPQRSEAVQQDGLTLTTEHLPNRDQQVTGSSKPSMVGDTGIEPVASSV